MKKIKEIITGLEAGKELHHKDWVDDAYSILVDGVLEDNDGCNEYFSEVITGNYLAGFYLTEHKVDPINKIKEIITRLEAGLEAGKKLYHEDWDKGVYSVLADSTLKDENGIVENFLEVITEYSLSGFYFKVGGSND